MVADIPAEAHAKLISVVRAPRRRAAPLVGSRHEHLRRAQSGIEGLVRMSHHRVASQRHVGSEANVNRTHCRVHRVITSGTAATRAAFVHGACDAVERIAADRGAAHARIPVIERIVKDGAIESSVPLSARCAALPRRPLVGVPARSSPYSTAMLSA
jgi:hypothetical protein